MSQGFELSPDVVLPVEAVTEIFAVVGKGKSGKSTTAVVMAEEMIGAGHPVLGRGFRGVVVGSAVLSGRPRRTAYPS